MQLIGRQGLDDSKSLCISSKAIQRKSVCYGAVDLVRRTVVRLLSQLMCAFDVLLKIESQPSEVSYNRHLGRRNLMKSFENFIQLCGVTVVAISPAKIIKSFTAHRRIFFDGKPELFGLTIQPPFGG